VTRKKKQKLSFRVPAWWRRCTGRPTTFGTPNVVVGEEERHSEREESFVL